MSDPASTLAHLLEFGSAPPSDPDWPWVWWMLYEAVAHVGGSRDERWAKFEELVSSQPDSFQIRADVLAAVPIRENRILHNRFIYSAADAFGSPPPLDWCVDGLFARPSLNLLVGDPGSKKTLLALDLAVCVAMGVPWLGRATSPRVALSGAVKPAPESQINNSEGSSASPLSEPSTTPNHLPSVAEPLSSLPPAATSTSPLPQAGEGSGVRGVRHTTPTLIIDEETGKPRLWARIHGALQAHQAKPDIPFHYMSLANFDLRDPDECLALQEAAESVSAGLIIIDALADVIRGSDENSVLAIQPFFTRMRHLAEATHSAVLILHHNNRSGSFRGSSVISAGVDLLLSIESPPDSSLIHLRPLKTRDAAPEPFSARIHFNGDQFHLTPSNEKPGTKRTDRSTATAILDLLAESKEADTQQLFNRMDGISLGTIRNALHQLKLSGLIERSDGGSMGSKASYQLSVKGLELLTINDAPASHDDD